MRLNADFIAGVVAGIVLFLIFGELRTLLENNPTLLQRQPQPSIKAVKTKSRYTHPFFVELDKDNDFVYLQLPVDDRETTVYNGMTKKEYDILEMDYLRYIVTQQYDCRERVRAGNIDEGGWEVCLDPPFNIKRNQCLVYSFGIKDDWSYDDYMVKKGCEVHSFDPTIGKEDHQRKPRNFFHNLGLSGFDGVQGFPVKKLSTIMQMLGHTKRTIDFLKFDIELSEWSAIKTMIEDRSILKVKQMAAELHTPFNSRVIPTMEQMQLIKDLKNTGFKIFFSSYQFSPHCRKFSPQTKRLVHAFINIHFVNTNFVNEKR
ncbi:methyltransferase-like protein 24 [Lingula anatina]|uniref:Methyltransferase-like protein 24 n=1 Tax=Lingula anatina TaxID=7574 RepID=A0A1S3H667_LINAN|nr:methyltransferase-like protein 24 [Lingula anatina]|eukprot:XP_013380971.1 methyltransferase-like protein 24 [Lingula anatina]